MSSSIWPHGVLRGSGDVDKFGSNPGLNTSTYEDIWSVGGLYNYESSSAGDGTGIEAAISSSSTSDTFEIAVDGLDEDGNEQIVYTNLQGQTKTVISGTWSRIFRMWNNGSTASVGTIYAYVSNDTVSSGVPQTASKIKAQIIIGQEQSLICLWTMPRGKHGYIQQLEGFLTDNVTSNRGATLELQTRIPGKVFRTKKRFSVNAGGSSSIQLLTGTVGTGLIDELTDIKMRGLALGGAVAVSAGFHVDYWSKNL